MVVEAAKMALNNARMAWDDAEAKTDVIGAQIFQLYANPLLDKACQPLDKIVKAQTNTVPWEDLKGEVHQSKGCKTWESFLDCVTFHLQIMFHHDAGEVVKYYVTNMLKKPNRVSVRQFFVHVKQLNSYLKNLPCLYDSPKSNLATKWVAPLH